MVGQFNGRKIADVIECQIYALQPQTLTEIYGRRQVTAIHCELFKSGRNGIMQKGQATHKLHII
jgi:hypothetical protein